jgi:trimeric autotransporter adhesin
MILLRATRKMRVCLTGMKPLAAPLLLGFMAILSGCNGSSSSSAAPMAQLASIAVGPPDSSVAMGLSNQFTATGLYSDGSKQDVSSQVTWNSANANMASIDHTGLATAHNPGSTTITATLGHLSGSTTLNVTAATLVVIDISPANASIANGLTNRFIAAGVYSDNSVHDLTTAVTWSSSATSVASISNTAGSNGLATSASPGASTITATVNGLSATTTLTVTAATLVSIGVTPANLSMANGLKNQFTAIGVYTDHSTHDLTSSAIWSSSAPAIASVSNNAGSNGLTSTLSPGSSTITASMGGVQGSTSLTVTAASLVSIGITPMGSSIASGLKSQFTAIGTYTDNSTQNLTAQVVWASSDPSVAALSNASGFDGIGSALSPGAVTVTATLGGVSGSTAFNVTAATLAAISVTPTNPSIARGLANHFVATGIYTDNSTQNLTSSVAWTTSDSSIASVSNGAGSAGLAMGISTGSTSITAASGSISGSTLLSVTPATLVSINLTPSNPSIANGLTSQFVATGLYTDNSTQNLTTSATWTSSDTTLASVSNATGSRGLAMASSPGATTITAASGGVSGSTLLTVTPATLVSISVTPANSSIADGLTNQFVATGVFTDNTTQNLTGSVAWSSSDATVATLSNATPSQGLAMAINTGSTTITAASGSVSGSTLLSVTPATLVSIAVTPTNPTIADGLTSQFAATGVYTDNSTQNLTTQVTWTSSDNSAVTISNAAGSIGLASSLSQGSVNISAVLGSVSGSTGLTVTAATLVSIAVTPSNAAIAKGTNQQFAATGTYTDTSTHDITAAVTWGSSDPTLASISNAAGSTGLASAIAMGSATITATAGAIHGSTGLVITPATLISIAVIPANPSIAKGTGQQFVATGTYTDNSTQPLTTTVMWSSSDPTVASISNALGSNGLATSVNQGSTTITATAGTVSGSTGLTVTAAVLTSIAVTPANAKIIDATSQQFTATGTYTDSSTQNLTTSVTWNSSHNAIASISNAAGSSGFATGIGIGSTSISAALGTVNSPAATLTASADPQYAYAANQNVNTLSQYTIGANGSLTTNGAAVPTGQEPNAVVEDPSGRYVYVANWIDATLSEYSIGAGGALTSIGTVPTGGNPASVAIDASGSYVYVANLASSSISQYAIGAGGALSSIGTLTAANGPSCITVDPVAPYVYAANQNSNDISQFTIGAGGVLTLTATVAAGGFPQSVAVDATGQYAYVANYSDGTLSEYSIGAGGALNAIGTVAAGSNPESVTIDPTGPYVYAANYTGNTLSEYKIGAGGLLTPIGTVATGNGPWFVTVDATGRYVYVADFADSTISEYSIGAGGALTLIGTVATGSGPNAVDTGF